MAGGTTVANAFVQIMPSFQGAESAITSALVPATESAADAAGSAGGDSILSAITGALGDLGGKLGELGNGAGNALVEGISGVVSAAGPAAIAAAVVAAGVGVGTALEGIGEQFDGMSDTIVATTGASGTALSGMEDAAKKVATTVPVSFEDAGSTVATFSQRMGLAGDALTEVSSKSEALGELTGQAVNVDALTGAFNAFGISGEDASKEMDYLYGVSQQTGIGFNSLVSTVQSAGPAMTQLGFSFNDTADMAGQLDKAGLNSSAVLGSMKKALTSVAESGGDVQGTFRDTIGSIQEYIKAGDDAKAVSAASDLFGTRNAPQFVAALKSGAINMDSLGKSALGAKGDIMGTMESTDDWPEKWKLIQNNVSAALEPLGSGVMSGVTQAVEALGQGMDFLWQATSPVRDAISDLASGALAQLSPVLQPVATALGQLGQEIGPTVAAAFQGLAGALRVVGAVLSVVWGVVSPVAQVFAGVLAVAINVVKSAFTALAPILSGAGSLFSSVASFIQGAWSGVSGFFSGICNAIKSTFTGLANAASSIFQGIASAVGGIVNGMGSTLASAWNGIKSTASSAFGAVKSAISDKLHGAADVVRNVVSAIKGAFNFHWSLPPLKLPHISVSGGEAPFGIGGKGSLPHFSIAWYAKGGIAQNAAIVGEAGDEAIVPYTNRNIMPWANALASAIGLPDSDGVTSDAVLDELRSLHRDVANLRVYIDKRTLVGSIASDARAARRMMA